MRLDQEAARHAGGQPIPKYARHAVVSLTKSDETLRLLTLPRKYEPAGPDRHSRNQTISCTVSTMAASASAVRLYDHSSSPAPLRSLLRTALPLSLPLYSTLSTPGLPTPVWATLSPGAVPENVQDSPPYVILADLGNQLRFFCSTEAKRDRTDDEVKDAAVLVSGALRQYLRQHAGQRDRESSPPSTDSCAPRSITCELTCQSPPAQGMSIGAIPDIWRQTVRDTFGVEPFSASEIHYRLLAGLPDTLTNGSTKGASVLPGGIVTTKGRKEDVAEVRFATPRWRMARIATR